MESLAQLLREKQARLQKTEKTLTEVKRQVPVGSDIVAAELADRTLEQARTLLEAKTSEARRLYENASSRLVSYKSSTPLAQWKQELDKLQGRLAQIELRLQTLATDRAKLEAKAKTVGEQLKATPERIVLKREVTGDPLTAAAASQAGLEALAGLSLENESLNPAYVRLLEQQNDIEAAMASLDSEAKALHQERQKLLDRTKTLQAEVARAEQTLSNLDIEADLAKKQYVRLAELQLVYQGGQSDLKIELNNSQYQNLKSSIITQEIELAELQARFDGLQAQLDENRKRIDELKQKVARAETERDRLRQVLDRTREAYWALKQKQTDLKIELASIQSGLAQVILPAYPVYEPVAPEKGVTLALAAVLGLILGVFWAFLAAALEEPGGKEARADEEAPSGVGG